MSGLPTAFAPGNVALLSFVVADGILSLEGHVIAVVPAPVVGVWILTASLLPALRHTAPRSER